jgi:hypothetical protein
MTTAIEAAAAAPAEIEAAGALRSATWLIDGVRCAGCAARIEAALLAEPRIAAARILPSRRFLALRHRLAEPLPAVNALLGPLGYRVAPRRWSDLLRVYAWYYRPLLLMLLLVAAFVLARQLVAGWSGHRAMADAMAGYFLLFGALKAANLGAFAGSYARYDGLAARSRAYALAYPFLELLLGAAYLAAPAASLLHGVTLALMAQKAWSVRRALLAGDAPQCACLGGFFSIPISRVTLAEDAAMAAMAALMLVLPA